MGGPDWDGDSTPHAIRFGIATSETMGSVVAFPSGVGPASGQHTAFCKALATSIGLPVVPSQYADYRSLLAAINEVEIEVAWLPPVIALRTISSGRTVPIALPVRGGVAWYSSALFAPAGSRIATIHDLHGARVAWVDRQSTSGYLVMRAWLRAQNLDPDSMFAEETFHGSHAAVSHAVISGAADVGATFAHVDWNTLAVTSAGWGASRVQVVALAGPIPSDVIAASVSLPVAAIRLVQHALVSAPTAELLQAASALLDASAFVAAESEHMAPLMSLLKHLDDDGRRILSVYPPAR
jgi:phosphonate transport system substrate-binding protein